MTDRVPPSPNLKRFLVFLLLLPWLFIALGGGALAFGVREYRLARESVTWPQVEGRILSSEVEWRSGTGKSHSRHVAVIRYEYTVNGATRTGKRDTYLSEQCGLTDPGTLVEQFPAGATVPVYYRPSDPAITVLVPGCDNTVFILPGVGLVFLLFGGFILVPIYKSVARVKRNLAAPGGLNSREGMAGMRRSACSRLPAAGIHRR
jgi:hypothetical protein